MSNLQRLSIGSATSTHSRRSSMSRQPTTYSKKAEPGQYEVIYSNGAACRKTKNLKSELITSIPIGSIVSVAEFKGRRCRITSPIAGWISAHTNDNLPIIKKEHEGLLHEGILSKRGHLNTSWKERYFILTDDLQLRYYDSELNSSMVVNHPKYVCGTIDLLSVHKMEVKVSKNTLSSSIPKHIKILRSDNDKNKNKSHIIRLVSSSRTYVLNAKDQTECETWLHLFYKYIYGGVIYESYGYKLGGSINASFKNRYLVINQYGQIKYYENEKRLQLHGWINLNTIKSFNRKKLHHNGAATEGLIELHDKSRVWLLCFETNDIQMKWCESLRYLNVPTKDTSIDVELKEEMKGDHIIKSNLELERELQTLEQRSETELQRLERQHENELKILRSQVRELKQKLRKLNRVDNTLKKTKIELKEEKANSKLLTEKVNKAKEMLRKEKDLTKQLRRHLDELCARDEAKTNNMEMDGPDQMVDSTPGFPSLAKKKTVWKRNYLLRKIDKWSNNDIIHWMKNVLAEEDDMNEQDKNKLISAVIDCGCDGRDLIALENVEDIGYSFDIIENMALCKKIYKDIQQLRLKEKMNLDSLETEDSNEPRFPVNIYSQGTYITLHKKVTKKTTIQNVKRLYKEQSGVSAGLRDIHLYAKMKVLVKWKTLEQCGIVDDKHLITVKFETAGGGE